LQVVFGVFGRVQLRVFVPYSSCQQTSIPHRSNVVAHLDMKSSKMSGFSRGDVTRLLGARSKRERVEEANDTKPLEPQLKKRHGNRVPELADQVADPILHCSSFVLSFSIALYL
jgi:hypothetical protein